MSDAGRGGDETTFFRRSESRRHFMPIITPCSFKIKSDPTWTDFQALEWSAIIIRFFELLQEEYDGIFHERKIRTSILVFN